MKRPTIPILAMMMVVGITAWSPAEQPEPRNKKGSAASAAAETPAYPLRVSANGRYLVDQQGTPFLIAGESPQALMVNLTEKDAALFFANRRSQDFNAVWISLARIEVRGVGQSHRAGTRKTREPSGLVEGGSRANSGVRSAISCFSVSLSPSCAGPTLGLAHPWEQF
jgi:hypothetical protein